MRRVLKNGTAVYRINPMLFSPDSAQPGVAGQVKLDIKEEDEGGLDFSQMFNNEVQKLSVV